MAKITRIKANDQPREKEESSAPTITRKKVIVADKKTTKAKRDQQKAAVKKLGSDSKHQSGKKPFILFRPFIALGHYLRDAWRELRQVRWPNRKTTWKMVLAVIVYSAIFMVIISYLTCSLVGYLI